MTKDDRIYIRINGKLKAAAQDYAKDTGRSLAGLIEWLLRQELKKNGIAERQEGREIMKALKEKLEEIMENEQNIQDYVISIEDYPLYDQKTDEVLINTSIGIWLQEKDYTDDVTGEVISPPQRMLYLFPGYPSSIVYYTNAGISPAGAQQIIELIK